jgi:hypothetical protein
MFGPALGAKPLPPRIMKFTILVEVFLLYINMHLVFLKYTYFQRFVLINSSILTLFAPPERPQGGKKPEIHNLCPPCPKDASYQI